MAQSIRLMVTTDNASAIAICDSVAGMVNFRSIRTKIPSPCCVPGSANKKYGAQYTPRPRAPEETSDISWWNTWQSECQDERADKSCIRVYIDRNPINSALKSGRRGKLLRSGGLITANYSARSNAVLGLPVRRRPSLQDLNIRLARTDANVLTNAAVSVR